MTICIPNAPIYKGIPGAILKVEKDSFIVKTGDSFVKFLEWISKDQINVGDRLK
jgi:methionyl-tRNA formyltransferase